MRRRRRRGLCWLWLVATSCTPDFPPHWIYTTGVDRTAATVVWTGTHGGTTECRTSGAPPVTAPAVPRERGLVSARVEGLTPGTRYACRIVAPDGQPVARVHFRTAPADDVPLLFTVVGDSGHGGPVAKAIARRIRAAHPAFLIHVGDFAYNHGSREDMKDRFFPPYRGTLRRLPIFPTPGNHDLVRHSIYRTLFAPASDQRPGDGLRYRFRWGPAAFVSIDSPDGAAGAPGLADDLAADGPAAWRIVFLHEPLHPLVSRGVERQIGRAHV